MLLETLIPIEILEQLCRVLASLASTTQIVKYLHDYGLIVINTNISKANILIDSLNQLQKRNSDSNKIIDFIEIIFNPVRYIGREDEFKSKIVELNQILFFIDLEIGITGKIIKLNNEKSDYKISKPVKLELLEALLNEENPFGPEDDNWIMGFLDDIWNLRLLKSEDSRFSDAYKDIYQHTVNNNDYSIKELFIDRLKLLDDNNLYIIFLEKIVSVKYRKNRDEIIKYVILINSYIEKNGFNLILNTYDEEENPIYKFGKKHEIALKDVPLNNIEFYVDSNPIGRSDYLGHHKPPLQYPAFVLVMDNKWNDFNYYTKYSLFYYDVSGIGQLIGALKITDGISINTQDILPLKFVGLQNFCSLGQSIEYYLNLNNILPSKFLSILYALNDAAFIPQVYDNFVNNEIFKISLIRKDQVEQLLRTAKYQINNYDTSDLFSFKYKFNPKYSKETIQMSFDFKKSIINRMVAIIGKNGVGKTQFMTQLPLDISNKEQEKFNPKTPLFSKVLALSYSIFDSFEIPTNSSLLNYMYCGLRSQDGKLLPINELAEKNLKNITIIKNYDRLIKWQKILLNFLPREEVSSFIFVDEYETVCNFDNNKYSKLYSIMSSGHKIILNIITDIVANIRYDSLLLFDEPETHLHPNAITELINSIFSLLKEFDSYCIMTTHSPLIIQALLSTNVYVLERDIDIPSIRKIGIETFGENLSVLTDEVFGNKSTMKQYKMIIDDLIKQNQYNYLQIVKLLESDNMPLSLNARLYIKSKIQHD